MTAAQRRVLDVLAAGGMIYRKSLNHRGWRLQNAEQRIVGVAIQQRVVRPLFDEGWIEHVGPGMHAQAEITPAGRAAVAAPATRRRGAVDEREG